MVTSARPWLSRPGGLAARLRRVRTEAGIASKDLAEQLGWDRSKVSRVESGERKPTQDDVRAWGAACGANKKTIAGLLELLNEAEDAHQDWKSRMRRGQADVQEDYAQLIAEASRIVYFEITWVPGPLQTVDYMRRVFRETVELHRLAIDDVEEAITKRLRHQEMVYDPSKHWEFLIGESVLRWLLVPPDAMRAQLNKIQTFVGLPNVRLGVIPMGVELSAVPQNGFQMYDDTVMVETFASESTCTPHEVESYRVALERMWPDAKEGDEARRLIVAAGNALSDKDQ